MFVKGKVKLYSTSVLYNGRTRKEPVSLTWSVGETSDEERHVDINSFRPNPVDFLTPDKSYDSDLYFETMLIPCIKDDRKWSEIKILRRVKIPGARAEFANIR